MFIKIRNFNCTPKMLITLLRILNECKVCIISEIKESKLLYQKLCIKAQVSLITSEIHPNQNNPLVYYSPVRHINTKNRNTRNIFNSAIPNHHFTTKVHTKNYDYCQPLNTTPEAAGVPKRCSPAAADGPERRKEIGDGKG